jgi:hypothetical protein
MDCPALSDLAMKHVHAIVSMGHALIPLIAVDRPRRESAALAAPLKVTAMPTKAVASTIFFMSWSQYSALGIRRAWSAHRRTSDNPERN